MSENSRKELLLAQHSACFDEPNWFVPLKTVLEGVTLEEAIWSEGETANSIWQIVNHLTFWNERYVQKFKELPLEDINIDNSETFVSGEELTEENWVNAVQRLHNVMSEWRNAIAESSEEKLNGHYRKEPSQTWWSVIANINIHNAYHIGQILQIRKHLDSWNTEKGVH